MKIIKIIFFTLLALSLISGTCIFIFLQIFDTDQYLPTITKKASLALGRPVSIGHLSLGLSLRGITLDAGPLTVADDTVFTAQPFILVDRARISLDLRSLVLQRKIHISNILLQSPQIHIIRSQEGNFNIRSIGQTSQSAGGSVDSLALAGKAPQGESSTIVSSPARMASPNIEIQDAAVSFIDQNQTMPLDLWLMHINASLDDFSLSSPFQIVFGAAPLLLKGISPGDPDSPIFKNITGVVQINMSGLQMGPSSGPTASGDINLTGGVFKNFNLIKTALSHTLGVFHPGLWPVEAGSGNMDAMIDKLGADDTIIDQLHARFSYHDKTLFIDDSLIKTNIFEMTAKGSIDQGLNLDMQTKLHLNTDISASLVNELDGLKYLMDDSNRIAIGGGLKGRIPHLKYKPDKDFKKKSKKAFIEEGGNILGVLLGGLK